MTPGREAQLASTVLMIRPVRFESNPMTIASNAFQSDVDLSADEQQERAAAEFEVLRELLEDNGIRVIAVDDTRAPHTPDAVFPNNWVTFHADGTVVLYPMEAENRRTERREDILESIAGDHGFHVSRVIDLSHHEREGRFLEGTGSMVLDRVNRIAYACVSTRTHIDVLGEFSQLLDYEVLAFSAVDSNGDAIYHTNVLMNVGETLAVICDEALPNEDQRQAVLQRLRDTGHAVVTIDYHQLGMFAGNMLQMKSQNGETVIVMSGQARDSLHDEQLANIEQHARIISAHIDNIEHSAGGSVRCMLAEVHLPDRSPA